VREIDTRPCVVKVACATRKDKTVMGAMDSEILVKDERKNSLNTRKTD
jgi:hypothetical protein